MVNIACSGSKQARLIGMKVDDSIAMMIDEVGHVLIDEFASRGNSLRGGASGCFAIEFIGHRFDAEVEFTVRMVDEI